VAKLLDGDCVLRVGPEACEAGLNAVVSPRRAFRIAGAQTVLASHWKVSDTATPPIDDGIHPALAPWRAPHEGVAGSAVVPVTLEGIRQPLFLGSLHAHRAVAVNRRAERLHPVTSRFVQLPGPPTA